MVYQELQTRTRFKRHPIKTARALTTEPKHHDSKNSLKS